MFDVVQIITTYGYIGIFTIVFLESGIFFPLPGDSLLFTAGLLASQGYMIFAVLVGIVAIATFLGSLAGYVIGQYIEALHRFRIFRKILAPQYIDAVHIFFEKHGRGAILLSRFVPIIRTFAPIAAGIGSMQWRAFVRYNVISSVVWALVVPSAGYFLGRAFPQIKDYLSLAIIIIVILSILPGVFHAVRRR